MQTSVETTPPIGVPGQLATEFDEHNARVDSGTNEEAATNIPFGIMVKRGTTKGQIKLPTAATDYLEGVVAHANEFDAESQLADATVNDFDQSAIKPGVTAGLIQSGVVIVVPEDTDVETAGVHVRIAANGGNTQLGAFTPNPDDVNTIDLTPCARWVDAPVAGQLTRVWIDLPASGLVTSDET